MATVPLLSRKVSSVQKVSTAMSNLVYYSSQKKCTHLQVILFSFLFRIWTPLSFLLDKDHKRSHSLFWYGAGDQSFLLPLPMNPLEDK